MESLDPNTVRRACSRFLTYHYPSSPREVLADLAAWTDPQLESDRYGTGPLIADFEAEIATLLGKEMALFLPSGTMAQVIALRIWAERAQRRAVAFHPTCHLELHEEGAYRVLHGLHGVLVGNRTQLLTRADLDSEPGLIRLTQFIEQPPAKVWQALTHPALLAKWWAAGDIRPVVGHRFSLDMGSWGQQACEVLAVEPERFLAYSFAPGTLNTTLTWRLQSEGNGTRLWLEHRGFDLDSPLGKRAFEGMGAGWPNVLARIAPALAAAAEEQPTLAPEGT
jgi:uncharacterized protein YndB with AHSA1/START domain